MNLAIPPGIPLQFIGMLLQQITLLTFLFSHCYDRYSHIHGDCHYNQQVLFTLLSYAILISKPD